MGLLSFFSLDCTANLYSEDTKRESIALFNNAHQSIKIVAGRLDNDFYTDNRVINALNNAVDRGVSIDIAYVPSVNNKKFKKHLAEQVPKARITAAKKIPQRHWVSIDSKHLRIEHTHPEGAQTTPAFVCRNAKILTKEWDKKFESLV